MEGEGSEEEEAEEEAGEGWERVLVGEDGDGGDVVKETLLEVEEMVKTESETSLYGMASETGRALIAVVVAASVAAAVAARNDALAVVDEAAVAAEEAAEALEAAFRRGGIGGGMAVKAEYGC